LTDVASGPPASGSQAGRRPEAIKAIPVRHVGRWVSAAVVVAIISDIVYTVATAKVQWDISANYLFNRLIRDGAILTIELTIAAMVIGITLGAILAVMRLSPNPVTSSVSWFYIWFFRGTPVLVQIFFWFNLNSILPNIGLGILPNGPWIWHEGTNQLISPIIAAILGLGLNEAAYMAEIVRAGIISVDLGQTEAAQALGMTRLTVMRRIVLPQAMRVIIPPTGNETISMLKTTSLAFVAAVPELFTRSQQIANFNYRVIELITVASLWYLVMTSVLTVGQYYVERHFARGTQRELPPTPFQSFRKMFFTYHAPMPQPQPASARDGQR
jgi:polar amino acid transport system permease protein